MKNLFKTDGNFIEDLISRVIYLFLIILSIALTFLVFKKYYIFLDLLPFFTFVFFLFIGLFVFLNKKEIKFKENKIIYFILLFLLIFSAFNSFYFFESKIEGGHDQGGYFETALLLSNTGHYYEDYSERPVSINTPGYRLYSENQTRWHFIPGGPVYFSIFHSLFGIAGFSISLAFTLFFSTAIIFFLCRKIRNWKTGILFILFFLFYSYTIYFSRATWVENIQLLLVWFYVYLFIKGYMEKEMKYFLYASLPISLLMFFRLEAILYVFIYFLLTLFFCSFKREKFKRPPTLFPFLIVGFSIFLIIFIFIFDSGTLLYNPNSVINGIINTISNPAARIAHGPQEVIPYNEQVFIWVFLLYMFGSSFVIMCVLSLFNFFREVKEIKRIILLISILILPQFFFLVRPSIALYIPWAARRFWAVFIPYIFLLFSVFLTNPSNPLKKPTRFFSVFVVLMFLLSSFSGISSILSASGKGILDFEEKVAGNFNETDLVIFWDKYRYENWGPPLYFLHGTNVVFDRPPEFDKEIYALFMRDYPDIYIATSKGINAKPHPYFGKEMIYIKTINSSIFKVIGSTCDVRRYAAKPLLFEGYHQIRDLCTDNEYPKQLTYEIKLNIYKINDSFKKEFIDENYDPNYTITAETENFWH